MQRIFTYSFLFLMLVFASCVDKPVYPSQPVIAYKDFLRYGSYASPDSVEAVISFTDNEGDIGLEKADTNGIFNAGNLYMVYLYDSTGNGDWRMWDNDPSTAVMDTFMVAYRVPPVLPEGDPKEPMKGLIYVKLFSFHPPVHPKIMYVVYLYDKALHRSDTIHTPAILF